MSDSKPVLAAIAILVLLFAAYILLNPAAPSSSTPSSSTPKPTAAVLAGENQQALTLGASPIVATYTRSADGRTDTVRLSNDGPQDVQVAVFTITPKDDASSASELTLSGSYFVLEDDPVTVQTLSVGSGRTAEVTVTKSRASQYGRIQLVVDFNAWQAADREALTEFVKYVNARAPALKYDDARLLSYDLNYQLNDKSVELAQRVANAKTLFDAKLPELQSKGALATSSTETLYSEKDGQLLAAVDPMSGLAYFKGGSQVLFTYLQGKAQAMEFVTTAGVMRGAKVYYSLCGGQLCVLVDLHDAQDFKDARGAARQWSGSLQLVGDTDATHRIPDVQLFMDDAPSYALYSPKIVKAGNQGQPVYLVNNLPYAVDGYAKNSIRYVGPLASDHPLKAQTWFNPAWYSVASSGLEGTAFPETYSLLDLFVTPSACLDRLCTCPQLHYGLAGGIGASQTAAQTYFGFFYALQSDFNAKALLQKARIADPSLLLVIRGQNLGPECSIEGQSFEQKTSVLKLTYSIASARVQYAVQNPPLQDSETNGRYLYGPNGLVQSDDYDAALTRLDQKDLYTDLTEDLVS